ncbi:MAG: class I SAM-dependent methyltransferase [Puniceicoccaceae bacterium]
MSLTESIKDRPWRNLPFTDIYKRAKRSLLTGQERQMCYWLSREWYSGEGAIVDLGSFLGSSTVAFAAGLAEREDGLGHVHAYDLFEVSRDQETQRFLNKKEGDSFLEDFQSTIAGFEDKISVNAGDIKQFPWEGGPIEIFFVDLAKSWEMNEYIIQAFYPYLIPGKSILIHEDFGNSWNPWLPVSMGYLEPFFQFLGDECPSRLYHCASIPTAEALTVNYKEDLDRETRLRCMDHSLACSSDEMLFRLHGSKAILTFIEDGKEAGMEYIDSVWAAMEASEQEQEFMQTVRSTIDFWNHGWAYENEMATKF